LNYYSDTHVDDVDDYDDIPPAVKRGGRKSLNNVAAGGRLDLDMSRNDCTTTSTTQPPQHHNGYTTMPHSMQNNNNEQQPTAQMQQHVVVQQQPTMMQQQPMMMQQQQQPMMMQQQQPMMMQQPMMGPQHPFIPPGGNPRAMQLDPNYMAFVGTSYMAMCMAYSNQNQR
jgi:hypothetical protein